MNSKSVFLGSNRVQYELYELNRFGPGSFQATHMLIHYGEYMRKIIGKCKMENGRDLDPKKVRDITTLKDYIVCYSLTHSGVACVYNDINGWLFNVYPVYNDPEYAGELIKVGATSYDIVEFWEEPLRISRMGRDAWFTFDVDTRMLLQFEGAKRDYTSVLKEFATSEIIATYNAVMGIICGEGLR